MTGIFMTSTEVDSYLTLTDAQGTILRRDDNSYGAPDAMILQWLPAGTYRINASASSGSQRGRYRVDVFREPHGGDTWICRRNPSLRLPYGRVVRRTADVVLTADLEQGSLHEALAAAGIHLRRGNAIIAAAPAGAEDVRLFGVPVGSPLLVERRVISDMQGHPVEATESRYPWDRYALDVRFEVEER